MQRETEMLCPSRTSPSVRRHERLSSLAAGLVSPRSAGGSMPRAVQTCGPLPRNVRRPTPGKRMLAEPKMRPLGRPKALEKRPKMFGVGWDRGGKQFSREQRRSKIARRLASPRRPGRSQQFSSGEIDRLARGDAAKRLRLADQYRLAGQGDVARQLGLQKHGRELAKAGAAANLCGSNARAGQITATCITRTFTTDWLVRRTWPIASGSTTWGRHSLPDCAGIRLGTPGWSGRGIATAWCIGIRGRCGAGRRSTILARRGSIGKRPVGWR